MSAEREGPAKTGLEELTTVRRVATPTLSSADVVLLDSEAPATAPPSAGEGETWGSGELVAGRYRLTRLLGQGGMGEVFVATDTRREGLQVAVKRMFTADPKAFVRLKREYRRMEGISHPNLVTLFELAEHRGRPFIVMEYVEGQDFYAALGDEAFEDLGRLRRLLRELAAGVLELHEAGRVHRDLKGSNVMVTPQDRVVILDFGLVNELERRTLFTSMLGRIEGTALYMSPEQAAGQLSAPPSDWYAFGVMLYRGLTGRYPLFGNPYQLVLVKQTAVAPRASQAEQRIPPDLDELIARLLEREPARRATGLDVLAWCDLPGDGPPRPGVRTPRPIITRGLIGREREQSTLARALLRFLQRVPLRVDISGASGTGKTALLQQFIGTMKQDPGFIVLESRCHEYDSVPYKVFDGLIDTLGRYLSHLPRPQVEPLLGEGFHWLTQLFPTLRQVRDSSGAEAIFRRLGLAEGEMAPQALRQRAFQALRALLHRLAVSTRLVLAVDDLQWGDLDSARLLSELLAPPGAPPLLFICAYRSEDIARSAMLRELAALQAMSARQHEVVRVETTPLGMEQATELAHQMLGGGSQPGTRSEAIALESQGNPMLIAAIVRYLGDTSQEEAPTRVTLARRQVSIEQLAAGRLTQLGPEATALIEVIATAGQPTRLEQLAAAAAVPGDPRALLAHLRAAFLVRTTRTGETDEVEVYHHEIRRAVVQRMTPAVLMERHRRLGAVLAAADAEPERLAYHWHAAGELAKAYDAANEAALLALRSCAFERACELFRLALTCAPEKPGLQRKLAEALVSAGHVAEAVPLLLASAEQTSRPALARRLRREAAEHLLVIGKHARGLEVLAPMMRELSLGYPDQERAAHLRLTEAMARLVGRGLLWNERSRLELSSRELERQELSWTLCKGHVLDDLVRGGLFAVETAVSALDLGEPRQIATSLAMAGAVALERGVSEGREWLKEAGKVAEKIGDEAASAFIAICWGLVLRGRGSWGQALTELEFGLRRLPPGASWENSLAAGSLLASLEALGEIAALGLRSQQMMKLAQDLGSPRIYGLGLISNAWTALVADDVMQCLSRLVEVEALLAEEDIHVIHLHALKVRVECDLYMGDPNAAWRRINDIWPRLERSRLFDAGVRRFIAFSVRARAGLALWASGGPAHLPEVVEQDVARLEREMAEHAVPLVRLLRAGMAAVRGAQGVEDELRAALSGFDASAMAIHATCVRRSLAQRQATDEGRAEVERADALMRMQGVARPERWSAVLMPGVENG